MEKTSYENIDFMQDKYWRVEITPKQARALRERNVSNNRSLKRKKETYARDMKYGKWMEGTGETIKFNENGELCDGQNRLYAIELAGVPVVVDIKTMVPNNAFAVIDSGVPRDDGDALKILQVPNSARTAAMSRIVQVLKNGSNNIGTHAGMNVNPSRQEVVEFVLEHNDKLQELGNRFANMAKRLEVKGMGPSGWFVCWWLTYCKDKERAEEFINIVENGEGAGGQLLATIMEKNPDGKPKAREWMVYKYIECFNATMLGGKYILGTTNDEMISGCKKLFTEYCDNMRVGDDLF